MFNHFATDVKAEPVK